MFIGIDLGGTNAQGALASGKSIVATKKIPTRASLGAETVINDLAKMVKDLSFGHRIHAIGLGVPGLLDLEKGLCVFSGNLQWENVPIVHELSRLTQAKVFIDNDVRVAALGELAQGKARGVKNFIYITVGTGIGSGIYVDNNLLRGPGWSAGEVGHMVLKPQGPQCTCGSKGCLEALASATAIAREGRLAAKENPTSLLNQLAHSPEEIDAALVFQASQQGDEVAYKVFAQAMEWLGIGVANLVNIFNPKLVVIGGGVSLAKEKLLDPVRQKVQELAMPVQRRMVTITTSAMGDAAGVTGAIELATRELYQRR